MSKGEGLYPAPTRERLNELDAQIAVIEKSTRATIPAMIPLHDILRQKFRWYYKWTSWPASKIINVFVLIVYIFGASFFALNFFKSSKQVLASATDCIWVGSTDSSWQTESNWLICVPGPGNNAVLNDTSSNDMTIDVAAHVASIEVTSDYHGTINANFDLTTDKSQGGTGDFTLAGGTYNANNTSLNIAGNFNVTTGTFTAGTSTVKMDQGGTISTNGQSLYDFTVAGNTNTQLDTGWVTPDDVTSVSSLIDQSSSGGTEWLNPLNAMSDDSSYASSHPFDTNGPPKDQMVKLYWNSYVSSDNKASADDWGTEATQTYGSSSDGWRFSSHGDTNNGKDAGFGVYIQISAIGHNYLPVSSQALRASFASHAPPADANFLGAEVQVTRKGDASLATGYVNSIKMKAYYASISHETVTAVGNVNVSNALNVNSNQELVINGGNTVTMAKDSIPTIPGTVSGDGTLELVDTAGANLDLTNGTLSSTVRFTTATMGFYLPVLNYAGNVEVYNGSGSSYNVTFKQGKTYTFNRNFTTIASATSPLSLLHETSVNLNVGGDVTFSNNTTFAKLDAYDFFTFTGSLPAKYTDNNTPVQNIGRVVIAKTGGPLFNILTLGSNMTVETMKVLADNTLDLASEGHILKLANSTVADANALTVEASGTLKTGTSSTVHFDTAPPSYPGPGGDTYVPAATYNNLRVSNELYMLTGALIATGDLTIDSGARLNMASYNIEVKGNWMTATDSAFIAGSGTVTFSGGANQIVTAGNTELDHQFHNITVTNLVGVTFADSITLLSDQVSASTLTAEAGSKIILTDGITFTIPSLYINGGPGNNVTLTTSGGNDAYFKVSEYNVKYVNVDHNDARSGVEIFAQNSTDTIPNNTNHNWNFGGVLVSKPLAPSGVWLDVKGSTSIDVKWIDNSDNESGFKVYMVQADTGNCDTLTYSEPPYTTTSSGATDQLVTGRSQNKRYCAKVVATNTGGDSEAYSQDARYTWADTPVAPTISKDGGSYNTLLAHINNTPTNPASTLYAFGIDNDIPPDDIDTGKWVQDGGSLGTIPAWKTVADWNGSSGQLVSGLAENTKYTFRVMAKNFDDIPTALSIGGWETTPTIDCTWTNGNNNNSWNVAGNWTCNMVPDITKNVFFDITSVANSTLDTPAATTIKSLTVEPNYTGTINATRDLTIVNSFSLSNGTYNANATSIVVGGNWTRAGPGGTFTAGGSTVTFNGSVTQAISGTNTWNNLTIANTNAVPNDTNDVDPDAVQTVNNNLLVSDGQYSPNAEDNYKNISVTFNDANIKGYLVPNAYININVSGNLAVDHDATFSANSGTVTFNGNNTLGKTINPGAMGFYNIIFNGSGSSWSPKARMSIGGSLTMTAGRFDDSNGSADVEVGGHVTGTDGVINFSSGTFRQYSLPSRSFGTTSGAADWTFNNLSFESVGIHVFPTFTLNGGGSGKIKVQDTLTIGTSIAFSTTTLDNETNDRTLEVKNVNILSDGIFKSSSTVPLTVAGNWTNLGTFNSGTGTVTFSGTTGAGGQILTGDTTFYNLTMDTNANGANQINFTAGSTQTISNDWNLRGYLNKVLTLKSTSDGSSWYFDIPGHINPSGNFINVKDSQTNTDYRITPGTNVNDLGNNTPGWLFSPPPPTLLPSGPTTDAISWNFTPVGSNQTGFKLYDGSGFKFDCPGGAAITACVETGLNINTQYTGRYVVAYNGYGESAHLNMPDTFTLAQTPGYPTVDTVTTSTDSLNVTINQNGNPLANTTYAIYETTTGQYIQEDNTPGFGGENWRNYTDWGGSNGSLISTLNPNTKYTFEVKARNGDLIPTASSLPASKYTMIETPAGVNFDPPTDTSVTMHASGSFPHLADDSSGLKFEITQGSGGGETCFALTHSNSCTDNGLAMGTQYGYRVRAFNGDGIATDWSSSAQITTTQSGLTAPGPVTLSNATTNSLVVNWVKTDLSQTNFRVYLEPSNGTPCGSVSYGSYITVTSPDTSHLFSGLTSSTQYCAQVVALVGAQPSSPAFSLSALFTLAYNSNSLGATPVTVSRIKVNFSPTPNPPLTTYYKIQETQVFGGQYLQDPSGGTAIINGNGEKWHTYADWGGPGGIFVTGLAINTQYTFVVTARNGDGIVALTPAPAQGSAYTYAQTPEAPIVTNVDGIATDKLNIKIKTNYNPANTQFAINCPTPNGYLLNHSTNSCEWPTDSPDLWRTYDGPNSWGGDLGFVKTNLSANTNYNFSVRVRNGDKLVPNNPQSSPVSPKYTLIEAPIDIAFNSITSNSMKLYSTNTPTNLNLGQSGLWFQPDIEGTPPGAGGTSDGFNIWRHDNIPFTDNGLAPNQSYCYSVKAQNGEGVGTTVASRCQTNGTLSIPTNVNLTATAIDALKVTWTDITDPVQNYRIYVSTAVANDSCTDPGTTYQLSPYDTVNPSVGTLDILNRSHNTQYCVKVAAYDGTNEAIGYSNAKYTLIETPTGITFGSVNSTSISMSVSNTLSNLNKGSSGVLFDTSTPGCGGGIDNFSLSRQVSSISDTGLTPNKQCGYSATAYNGDNIATSPATDAKYTFANVPTIIVEGKYDETNSYFEKVTIDANSNPNGTNYIVTYDTDSNGTFTSIAQDWTAHNNNESFNHTLPAGLTCNQPYYYRVTARNGNDILAGPSVNSSDTTPPCAPTGLNESYLQPTSVIMNWLEVAGLLPNYDVSFGIDPQASNLSIDSTSYARVLIKNNLTPNTSYYYKVRANNANGTGEWSSIKSFTTPPATSSLLVKLPGQEFISSTGISGDPSARIAGAPFDATIYAVDSGNTINPNYNKSVTFLTVTDALMSTYNVNHNNVPANPVTLASGHGTASFTFYQAGLNYFDVTDNDLGGQSTPFTVNPGPTDLTSSVTPPTKEVNIGEVVQINIKLKDIYTNNASYRNVTVKSDTAGDSITGGAATSADGTLVAYISSALPHTSTLTIMVEDTEGNVTLNTKPIITFQNPTSIDAPTNFTGVAGDANTTLYWNDPASILRLPTEIYRSLRAGEKGEKIGQSTNETYHDTGLTNGTTYYYTLKAVDTNGNFAETDQLRLTPQAAPLPPHIIPAPENLHTTLVEPTQIDLAWNPVDDNVVIGYKLYNAETGVLVAITVDPNHSLTGLTPETTYQFYVQAYDSAGNVSAPSESLTVTTPAVPGVIVPSVVTSIVLSNTPSEVTAGEHFVSPVRIMAVDGGGAVLRNYLGTVYFSSTDDSADLKWNRSNAYTFTSFDAGNHEFSGADFVLKTAGDQVLTVTDGSSSARADIRVISSGGSIEEPGTISEFINQNGTKVNTAVVTATAALLLAPAAINVAIGLGSIIPQILFWLTQFLQLLGFKKKRKPWGVVFNSQTGQPVNLATVKIFDKEYNRLLESTITDKQGRFSFLVRPGIFYLVAKKTGFTFPSEFKVSGFYENIYTGGDLRIEAKDEGSINLNIPIDSQAKASVTFTWWANLIKVNKFLQKIRLPLMIIGVIFALVMIIKSYNIIYALSLGLYAILFVIEYFQSKKSRPYGVVSDIFENPLGIAIVRIYDKDSNRLMATDVTDDQGRFKFLVSPGTYYMTAAKPGYIDFKSHMMYLERDKSMVTANIKLKKVENTPPQ